MVLSPRTFQHSVAEDLGDKPGGKTILDLGAGSRGENDIGFSTIAGFKGLEADAVLLVDVKDLESAKALLDIYIGASRARAVLGLALSEDLRESYNLRAEDFAERLAAGVI